MHKRTIGFSLVELLVVMTIMGILATVGLVAFRAAQVKARDATRKENLGAIRQALEMYYNDKGSYPSEAAITANWGKTFQDSVVYMAKLPTDPGGGTYVYKTMNSEKDFALFARLDNTRDAAVPLNLGAPGAYTGVVCHDPRLCNYVIHTKGFTNPSIGPDS